MTVKQEGAQLRKRTRQQLGIWELMPPPPMRLQMLHGARSNQQA